jgi:hypothetical protein
MTLSPPRRWRLTKNGDHFCAKAQTVFQAAWFYLFETADDADAH